MSEIQTVKTAIHEIAHAKLHAVKPDEKAAPEDKKDRHTKEVEAESVAYTVCQRYRNGLVFWHRAFPSYKCKNTADHSNSNANRSCNVAQIQETASCNCNCTGNC